MTNLHPLFENILRPFMSKTSDIRLCKDCKHCIPDKSLGLPFANCARKHNVDSLNYYAVDGQSEHNLASCAVQRSWGWLLARIYFSCGKEGRFWEAK